MTKEEYLISKGFIQDTTYSYVFTKYYYIGSGKKRDYVFLEINTHLDSGNVFTHIINVANSKITITEFFNKLHTNKNKANHDLEEYKKFIKEQ